MLHLEHALLRPRRGCNTFEVDMTVSIIIKALNEETHIGAAIESALAALAGRDGEVILADSGSTDRTVEIARTYPIRIVQLANHAERTCGAGPELGFQATRGDLVCLIDGDMVLDPEFITTASRFLLANPSHAGVAGRVRDVNLESLEYVRRNRRKSPELAAGEADRLNGGGLFRRDAILSVGYFTDRNLHSYEELDLGARLTAAGWRLHRLDIPFVDHRGHTTEAFALLWRRLETGYAFGLGELLRGALGRPHFWRVMNSARELRLWIALIAAWASLPLFAVIGSPAMAIAGALLLIIGPAAVMSWRYRSIRLGTYAVTAWHVHAIGLVAGLLRRRVDPGVRIRARVLHDGVALARSDAELGRLRA